MILTRRHIATAAVLAALLTLPIVASCLSGCSAPVVYVPAPTGPATPPPSPGPLQPLPPAPPPAPPPADAQGALDRVVVGATLSEVTSALGLGEPVVVPGSQFASESARWFVGDYMLEVRLDGARRVETKHLWRVEAVR